MDKDKAIEAARALVKAWDSTAVIKIKEDDLYQLDDLHKQVKALKEALEDKPSREDCIARLEHIAETYELDKPDNINVKAIRESIELLKQPTMQWIPHDSGCQPVFCATMVLIKCEDGYCVGEAGSWDWDEVIAYMIIE